MRVIKAVPVASLCATLALSALASQPARAQDASFGCKVLLCLGATSSPYCVPVMAKLYSDLDHGDPWPICAEANQVGGLHHVPYEDCPAGTQAGSMVTESSKDGGGSEWVPNANGGMCGRMSTSRGGSKDGGTTTTVSMSARPKRAKPYNVVITNNGVPQTIWFSITP